MKLKCLVDEQKCLDTTYYSSLVAYKESPQGESNKSNRKSKHQQLYTPCEFIIYKAPVDIIQSKESHSPSNEGIYPETLLHIISLDTL